LKTKHTLFLLLGIGFSLFASGEDDIIKNGDFSEGSSRWSGKKKIVFETQAKKNKVCKIEVKKKHSAIFYQTISTSKKTDLILTFRVKKSKDYKGKGYQVKFELQTDVTWFWGSSPAPKKADKWVKVNFRLKKERFKNSSHFKLMIKVNPGSSGYLMFDDFKIRED